MDSFGTRRTVVPLLVHEDCMDGIKTDLASQQESLSKIVNNTESASDKLNLIENSLYTVGQSVQEVAMNTVPIDQIRVGVESIESSTSSIRASSSNTATATSSLNSAVGTTADTATSNTVIGLLKSISNKLSL